MTPQEGVPHEEIERRQERCRWELAGVAPEAGGLLVFSRLNIYYLTGTYGAGVLWLPLEGEPVLLCRRGIERARLESPLASILPFRSFRDLPGLLASAGSPLSATVAGRDGGHHLGAGAHAGGAPRAGAAGPRRPGAEPGPGRQVPLGAGDPARRRRRPRPLPARAAAAR